MSSSPLPAPSELYQKKVPKIIAKRDSIAASANLFSPIDNTPGFVKVSQLDLRNLDPSRVVSTVKEDKLATKVPTKVVAKPRAKNHSTSTSKISDEKLSAAPKKTATKKSQVPKEPLEEQKVKKPRAKKADLNGESKPRKKANDAVVDLENGDGSIVKEKKPRKSRAKKTPEDLQTKLSGSVTKASTKPEKSGSKQTVIQESLNIEAECVDYGLVKAVKRKANWSPPHKSSITGLQNAGSIAGDLTARSPGSDSSTSNSFSNLLGSFGFTNIETTNSMTTKQSKETGVVRKRKLLELVSMNATATNAPAEAATPKTKAPKKKARTITDLATSAFNEEKVVEVESQPAPLLQYFSYQTTERSTKGGINGPAKLRSKSPLKRVKKGSSAQAPILLSPESAMKQAQHQDFIFGTSSQLAREESPTYLRDLHEAMQASNVMFEDPFDDPFKDVVDEPSAVAPRGRLRLSSKKGGLWSAGARDAAGSLLDVEMVDITDSPTVIRQQTPPRVPATTAPIDDVWHDVEADNSVKETIPEHVLGTSSKPGPVEAAIRLQLQGSPAILSPTKTKSPKRSTQTGVKAAPTVNPVAKKGKASGDQMPDFGAYTMFQLQKQIASYHFKPIKSRDSMIAVLEKCWEAKISKGKRSAKEGYYVGYPDFTD
ncbi:putative Structure-specific endonuclease subunit slx4 [Glarea lozoyensis 74030]|uniref:Putative Structure-specific endonuclease subunit slx4 n=1 Tax=Glarea lozoyensis (strain ATCC 74030 / MF5533) TaxID=1104152 RepID=H0EGY2_GLAL7|nr:putative Structure-specific endonuclease subunit slx4 [Glarea lozoyensis 74030]